MSHMDTVPVAEQTVSEWTHPPFSGTVDADRIWGRGSVDTKNTLIAQMEALELLLKRGFIPKRTVLLSYGFDEEISGEEGAKRIANFLLARYGPASMELIVDEGVGRTSKYNTPLALVGVQEKGYCDIQLTLTAPGGHSSIPPPHTSIGLLAHIITRIEANPHTPALPDQNPFLETLQCVAEWGGDQVDPWLKAALKRLDLFRDALVQKLYEREDTRFLISTSQAVDMIQGGTKGELGKARRRASESRRGGRIGR
ncbi:hypothetical protein BDK51DRAFT_21840 [Blyttiomyces helicus]|uniref:Uncharacterized protein n=1 Tax=Blyttiomyces helicus TaxID=388810 RepID=A0A4P9W009_9FUNG|nr:hypothetical protein BDK51DRAFT_21840 [Blyttiomyces helicus]|eukprot:RKO85429.1 hypothetical protein BDK51DRAFT_21840 [Blyttiomyces helicus]